MKRWLFALLFFSACGDVSDLDPDELAVSEDELRTNRNPERLVVWSNNIENMIFDWKDLVHAMSEAELRPDIFLVQQVTDKAEMDRLVDYMSRRLGVDYTGVVAKAHPKDRRFQDQIIPRPTVTTGIVYRTARFDQKTKDSYMPWGHGFNGAALRCDVRSDHTGYETLRLKLHDKVANKDVVAMSLRHWTWLPCSSKNVREIVNGFDGGPNAHAGLGTQSALHIVAGDFNDGLFQDGEYACWYRQMNGQVGQARCANDEDLGFTDPLFVSCGGDRGCVRDRGGIDSIFVRRGDGVRARTSNFDVVSFDEAHRASVAATGGDGDSNNRERDGYRDAGNNYSQHKARRAYVYYE
jgi:hypothetical protein